MESPENMESPWSHSETRRTVLRRVEEMVCKNRQLSYGDAENNLQDIADFWNLWLKKRGKITNEITKYDVCQMMSLMKCARKINNITLQDNWDDSVGYEVIGAAFAQEENEQSKAFSKPGKQVKHEHKPNTQKIS